MKDIVIELINSKIEMQKLFDKLGYLEESLLGMELQYEGDYATIIYADGNAQNVVLYVEDEDGESREVVLSLKELVELF